MIGNALPPTREINGHDEHAGISQRFACHKLQIGQSERLAEIRESAKELALLIARVTPRSREQSQAFTNVEQAVMWAVAAIERND